MQAINSLTQARWTSREESIEPELVLSPAELNPLNQRRKKRQPLCFLFPGVPYYIYMFVCLIFFRSIRQKPALQTEEKWPKDAYR